MKSFIFNGPLEISESEKEVEKLINFLNDNEGARVYFRSHGGSIWVSEILLEAINEKCGELVASGEISSCAFKIFFLATCKKRITKEAIGTYHLTGMSFRMTSKGAPDNEDDEFWFNEVKKCGQEDIDFCKSIGMNKEEVEKVANSRNVNFNNQRLAELLNNQK